MSYHMTSTMKTHDNDMKVQDAMRRVLKEFALFLQLKLQLILFIKDPSHLVWCLESSDYQFFWFANDS